MPKRKFFAAYVPVVHRGYLEFFDAYPDVNELYVFDLDILNELDYIRKDLRALTPEQQQQILSKMGRFEAVHQLGAKALSGLDAKENTFIMPDEDISRTVAVRLSEAQSKLHPVFLRWDRRNLENLDAKDNAQTVAANEFQANVMQKAMEKAGQSSDIWRRVGAVLIAPEGTEVGSGANQGEPTAHSPWLEGDPRNIFKRGVGIEMSVFTHAEAGLIAEAARRGIKLEGGEIYVTNFPCPACAKLIAHSGIKTCYYKDGYAVLDGKRVLEDYGVNLVHIHMDFPAEAHPHPAAWVPYKKG